MQKSISEMAQFMKSILPAEIPETYKVNPMFEGITDEESIRNGILAYRDFLQILYDQLIENGSRYDKPSSQTDKDDAHHVSLKVAYPFIYDIQKVLFNIGYRGELVNNNSSVMFENWQLLASSIMYGEWTSKEKLSTAKLIECLRVLSNCGISINGIDINTDKPNISKVSAVEIAYPDNPAMLIGLKKLR